ncbi:MAG: helix-turn-helix domain-containing protein [Candidatus Odinarchaeota archaeon]
MSDIKQSTLLELFDGITNNLIQNSDGRYIFKNNKYQMHSEITLGPNLRKDPKCIPSAEELGEIFEKEIVSKIPYAMLFIYGDLSVDVNIDPKNKNIESYHLAQKEIDIYESIKTLFFPTLKEIVIKHGTSSLERCYNYHRLYSVVREGESIYFRSPSVEIYRGIEGTAIDFLKEEIDYFFNSFKLRNPIPVDTIDLPQADLSLEDLLSDPNRKRKGYHPSELYSYDQKIKFLKKLVKDFLEFYPKIIINNFSRMRSSFFLFSNQPIKITVYTNKYQNMYHQEDISSLFIYEKLIGGDENQFLLIENEEENYDSKCLFRTKIFSWDSFLKMSALYRYYSTPNNVLTSEIYGLNALSFTYNIIRGELDEIVEKFREDSIFDEIKPFEVSVENWIKMILDTEERAGEDYNVEFKLEPTESRKGDGSGNDIYGHINAFENAKGGYIFIGVDESKSGVDKIIGLEPYLTSKNKNLDQLKREIRQKCFNYLGKDYYRIESRIYRGKSILRIKIPSNYGSTSWFHTSDGSLRAYIRRNGEKRQLSLQEIDQREKNIII